MKVFWAEAGPDAPVPFPKTLVIEFHTLDEYWLMDDILSMSLNIRRQLLDLEHPTVQILKQLQDVLRER